MVPIVRRQFRVNAIRWNSGIGRPMSSDAPISVKRLLELIKAKLEPAFAAVCVVGEVSNFRGSGRHWYFTLKEEGAALQCAVWASQQRLLALLQLGAAESLVPPLRAADD